MKDKNLFRLRHITIEDLENSNPVRDLSSVENTNKGIPPHAVRYADKS